jgi:G3E family GTPase
VKLLCIGGFLGSGKTTILMQVAHALVGAGRTVVIVENEIGEIGVDGDIVSELGIPVRELFGGCVCCTLKAGLVGTLRDIAAGIAPDWVIIEPTGLASPSDLVDAVQSWAPEVDDIRVLTVVDAARLDILLDVAAPLIEAQIKAGSVVAVNKVDEVDSVTLDYAESVVRALNPSAAIHAISAAGDDVAVILLRALQVSM